MTLLNTANRIYLGNAIASAVYAEAVRVWPPSVFATFDPAVALNVTLTGGNLVVTNNNYGSSFPQDARVVPGKTTGK
jgi:hypothetical protein